MLPTPHTATQAAGPHPLDEFIRRMPKVELHVHLEGSVRPETLLKLARQHGVALPADSVDGLREWYRFSDFGHFLEVYFQICECIRTPDDIELVAREFLTGQAQQNIRYSEVTYTPYTHYVQSGLAFEQQLAAINRARAWAESELGVSMGLILDISRDVSPAEGLITTEWAIGGMGRGVVALGLGGPEDGNPPTKFAEAFARARAAGLASVPHAGEVAGPQSMWDALHIAHAARIGHGVRCLEDPTLVDELRVSQVPLDVCPTSNVCLGVFPSLADHPLPRLIDAGLYVTLNSDDPPMFNTTLTDEYLAAAHVFGFGPDTLEWLALNGVRASLLPRETRARMEADFAAEFARLRAEVLN